MRSGRKKLKSKKFLINSNPSPFWRPITWIQTCASLHHRKKKKAEPIRLIPRKSVANLELLIGLRV